MNSQRRCLPVAFGASHSWPAPFSPWPLPCSPSTVNRGVVRRTISPHRVVDILSKRASTTNTSRLTTFYNMKTTAKAKDRAKHDNKRFTNSIGGSMAARLSVALVALGLLAVPCSRAETKLSPADARFILAAAQGGMTEVKLGELAAQKGTRDDVKAFGQMMVKDHTAINDNLKALAAQKGMTLPERLDAKHQGTVDRMTALTGAEFDTAYVADMVKDHKMDAKEFKAESAQTKDTNIKDFVDKSIPIVGEHLKRISAMKP